MSTSSLASENSLLTPQHNIKFISPDYFSACLAKVNNNKSAFSALFLTILLNVGRESVLEELRNPSFSWSSSSSSLFFD